MVAIEQARLVSRSLRSSLLIRLEPAVQGPQSSTALWGSLMISSSRQQIRQQMRDMRNTLSSSFIDQASLHLKAHIAQLTELKSVKKVALYLANDGELNPMPSIEWLWQQGIDVYIPVLHPFSKGQLLFLHFTASTELVSNKYGISEPRLDVQNICL